MFNDERRLMRFFSGERKKLVSLTEIYLFVFINSVSNEINVGKCINNLVIILLPLWIPITQCSCTKADKHGWTFFSVAAKEWETLPVLRPCQDEWHLIRQREPVPFFNSLQVQRTGTQCFNKQWRERNSNMHQCRLNTSDSRPPGKFRVRVRTRRVRDQVAGTQTRQALSPTLQGLVWQREEDRKKERLQNRQKKEQGRAARKIRKGGKACK